MGTSTRRYDPTGADREPLSRYENGDFTLVAICRECDHSRRLVVSMLIRMSAKGAETTLGEIRARLRCHKCGGKRVRLGLYTGARNAR